MKNKLLLFLSIIISLVVLLLSLAFFFTPENSEYHFNLGLSYTDKKMPRRALIHYRKALSIKKEKEQILPHEDLSFTPIYLEIATALHALKRNDEAIKELKKALHVSDWFDPNAFQIYKILGLIYQSDGRYEQALQSYTKALEINPLSVDLLLQISLLLQKKADTAQAIEYIKKLLALEPNHLLAHYNAANMYLQENKTTEALEHYTKALKLNPKLIEAFNNRGSIYYNQGQYQKAQHDWEAALALDPQRQSIQKNLKMLENTLSASEAKKTESNT